MQDTGVEDGNGHYVTLQGTYSKDGPKLFLQARWCILRRQNYDIAFLFTLKRVY